MEVIVSHNNLDFDGLAAMLAAKKLYPRAEMVFVGNLNRRVQEFMALYKDSLPVKSVKDINLAKIRRMILVDVKTPRRIGKFAELAGKGIDIVIYDHHPAGPDDLTGRLVVNQPTGAATTILVEEIKKEGLPLNAFEATILALGIYDDTGSLSFTTTTARDAAAVAFLLECGANLAVVSDFIDRPLTEEQRHLLNLLISGSETYLINGVQILLTSAKLEDYTDGLALILHKVGEINGSDAIFAVVQMGDRTHLVGRSRVDAVSIHRIMKEFGGAGHEKAASATVKQPLDSGLTARLLDVIREKILPVLTAKDIMSTPVKTVSADMSIDEAGRVMLRYGHTGLPVIDGNKLVGIISRRDLDKAKQHRLGHAPVKGFMSRKVVSIPSSATIKDIQYLMIDRDIGRLPVIENDRLVGIVTRTDVLRHLHGRHYPERFKTVFRREYRSGGADSCKELLHNRLPPSLISLLQLAGSIAQEHGWQVYAVGGFVRDLLLNVPNDDLDLVVEGSGPELAAALHQALGGKLTVHKKFATASVFLPDGRKTDIATARVEYYEYPAALPKVEVSSLKQDLYRRDFTINAMAIALNPRRFGQLIDYFGGYLDLKQKLVRVLYNLSFIEDPTRVLRAIRFEQRYGFRIEPETLGFAISAINNFLLEELSPDRIYHELKLIFQERDPLLIVKRMDKLKIWEHLLPERVFHDKLWQVLSSLQDYSKLLIEADLIKKVDQMVVYFAAMLRELPQPAFEQAVSGFPFTKWQLNTMREIRNRLPEAIDYALKQGVAGSSFYHLVKGLPAEGMALLAAELSCYGLAQDLLRFFQGISRNKREMTGHDLKALGLKPGPLYKKILDKITNARLDGDITTKSEELALAKKLMKEEGHV